MDQLYRSDSIAQLATALALAQGEITSAVKDADNPYFRSRYADLASIWDACRGPLARNGLAVVQCPTADGARITVITTLMHASGEYIGSALTITAQRQLKDGGGWEKVESPQAVGSTITYARRYALAAIVGIAPADDDDGEAAEGRPAPKRPTPAPRTPPPAKASPPQPEPPNPAAQLVWRDRPAMEAAFAEMQKLVGDQHFFYVLQAHGITPELKGKVSKIVEAYNLLRVRAEENVAEVHPA